MTKKKDGGYIGLKYARLALKDPETGKPISDEVLGLTTENNGIYKVTTTNDGGVASAALSGLAASIARIWGNNAVADISVGKAQPSVALTINFLNHFVLNKILGRETDGKGGFTLEGKPVEVALEIVSNTVAGGEIHFGFPNGYVTAGELSLGTDNENQTRVNDALTYTPFADDDGHAGKIYYTDDTGYDASVIDKEIFGVDTTPAPTE